MAVSITETPGADYTWDTADFTWDGSQAEVKPWNEANVVSFSCAVTETVNVAELGSRRVLLYKGDSLSVAEKVGKQVLLAPKEFLAVVDSYLDNIAFVLRVFETITVLEKAGKSVTIPKAESFGVSDRVKKSIGLNESEALTLLETFNRTVAYKLSMQEVVSVLEANAKKATVAKREAVAVQEKLKKSISVSRTETLRFVEVFGRTVKFKRALAEGLSVADALKKAYRMKKAEAVGVVDVLLRNSNAVVSDMMVSNQDITFEDFLKIVDTGRIPGFTDFRTFVQGDYEYSEAMFRVLLDATSSDRGAISDLKVSVDVPDVFDRGLATISNAANGLYVPFSRPFHISPEMSMVLKGGTVIAIPKLITLDQFGFTVKLFDVNNNAVTGSVSWAAHGY